MVTEFSNDLWDDLADHATPLLSTYPVRFASCRASDLVVEILSPSTAKKDKPDRLRGETWSKGVLGS